VVKALLADEDYQFVWYLAFADEPEPVLGLIRQIVPRSSSCTRIVDLIFGDAATDDFAACRRRTAKTNPAAERCQAARAAETAAAPSARTAAFLSQVAAACAE
jgi:hypothetical protein